MSTISVTHVPVLPETAPFTPAQRAWLNGFFAGLLGARGDVDAHASAQISAEGQAASQDEEFPWHDASLSISQRLALAEDRPIERKLMAAMAQLDCGACGYLCKTYAEALARGEEKDMSRCAPGGKETSKKLKELMAGVAKSATNVSVRSAAQSTVVAIPGSDRRNPTTARILHCARLNHPASNKDTRLVSFDIGGSGLTYKPGDSLGVFPQNCPDTVQWIIDALDASGDEIVSGGNGSELKLREALLTCYDLKKCTPTLIEMLAEVGKDATQCAALRAMLIDDGPGVPDGYELIDLLMEFPSARPAVERLVAALSPLNPRLYSIASSPLAYPQEVHLTVGVVRYVNARQRQCNGVASTFLAERARAGMSVRVFLQSSHGFGLPQDDNAPVIMVGPGTGIAPFRAFLQERLGRGAKGRNWLFFGDQRRDFDFLYEQELRDFQRQGVLSRLDTAFSRDQGQKVYVQDRMQENARELWAWLQEGAHFYVCGDAKRMANDVHLGLKRIAVEQGRISEEAAGAFITELSRTKRYQRDVY